MWERRPRRDYLQSINNQNPIPIPLPQEPPLPTPILKKGRTPGLVRNPGHWVSCRARITGWRFQVKGEISNVSQEIVSLAQILLGLVVYFGIIGLSLGLSMIPERKAKMNSKSG